MSSRVHARTCERALTRACVREVVTFVTLSGAASGSRRSVIADAEALRTAATPHNRALRTRGAVPGFINPDDLSRPET